MNCLAAVILDVIAILKSVFLPKMVAVFYSLIIYLVLKKFTNSIVKNTNYRNFNWCL